MAQFFKDSTSLFMKLQSALHQAFYNYTTLPNDPMKVILHTLSNGMSLYLSVNPIEPRVFTNIAVRAGSKQDPADTTGLAHYMEHMLFKGTKQIGTLDWAKEKAILEQISDLFEKHKFSENPEEKKEIYAEIDRLSQEAAKFVVPNEYDNLATAIGADGTNAYTWVDQTVFVNDIPSNEIERWMELEAERFSMMALRLFHTELETVYEEFNISQDKDIRKANNALRLSLFPKHPYGTQTTLGTAENLKNPSQVQIQKYFQTYYVPNNMAIIMAGDFNPDEVIRLAEKYFGHFEPKPIPTFTYDEQPAIDEPIRKAVWGNEAPFVMVGWRFGNSQSDDPLMLSLLNNLLHNDNCGLIDINLNQKQLVLSSESWAWNYQDYSIMGLYGKPKENQSLEEVEQLLLQQVEQLVEGHFDESLIKAIITNDQLQETKALERNRSRAYLMTESFILGINWERIVNRYNWYFQKSKEDIVAFAKAQLQQNHVVIYKRQGPDPNIIKVEKPEITPIELNRTGISDFAKQFLEKQPEELNPVFTNYSEALKHRILSNGVSFDYVHNPINNLFRLDFIFEMGGLSSKLLKTIEAYSELSGTSKYDTASLAMAFFKLGVRFDLYTLQRRTYITLQGLNSALDESLQLLEHYIADCQADEQVLTNLKQDIFTKRANDKKNKQVILKSAMNYYGRYGNESPYTFRMTESEILALKAEDIQQLIQSLFSYEHRVYYYGPDPIDQVQQTIESHHRVGNGLHTPLPLVNFQHKKHTTNKVYFTHFPMVQTELLLVSNGTPHFNFAEFIFQDWYNDYFGSGLSSIVFQEIRESKGFAYSCYAYAYYPKHQSYSHYLTAFLGTQPDKIADALPNMLNLIQEMPIIEKQIENARQAQLKHIASERVKPAQLYWENQAVKDLGFYHDLRQDIYNRLKHSTIADLKSYHRQFVQDRKFDIMILGDRSQIDFSYLQKFGEVQELSLEELFGY